MHAALAFLLILTIHRCYPAGVPRFLQGNLIRRHIRNYSQTLCILWAFAVLINLPLFAITKHETSHVNRTTTENYTNITSLIPQYSCDTGATEIWSRTYLILLLVLTYLITGIFLIVIYGQVIRIILASKKYSKDPIRNPQSHSDHYRFLSPTNMKDQYQMNFMIQTNGRGNKDIPHPHSSSSSSPGGSNRRHLPNTSAMPLLIPTSIGKNDPSKSSTSSHSTQHLQIIVMLFIVILLYILLLLPYRLLNLLFIVHNQIFQQSFMNEFMFQWLLNTVRLLVFLNCALQPITYLIISSRLRQTVIKLLRSWSKCSCHCQWSSTSTPPTDRHYKSDTRAIRAYLSQKYRTTSPSANQQKRNLFRDTRPLQTSLNNIHLITYHHLPQVRTPSPLGFTHLTHKTRYAVSFINQPRK